MSKSQLPLEFTAGEIDMFALAAVLLRHVRLTSFDGRFGNDDSVPLQLRATEAVLRDIVSDNETPSDHQTTQNTANKALVSLIKTAGEKARPQSQPRVRGSLS